MLVIKLVDPDCMVTYVVIVSTMMVRSPSTVSSEAKAEESNDIRNKTLFIGARWSLARWEKRRKECIGQ